MQQLSQDEQDSIRDNPDEKDCHVHCDCKKIVDTPDIHQLSQDEQESNRDTPDIQELITLAKKRKLSHSVIKSLENQNKIEKNIVVLE